MGKEKPESKVNLIKVSSTNALAFYSLIIVSLTSLIAALNMVETSQNRTFIIVGIVLVVMAMIIFVVLNMRNRDVKGMSVSGHDRNDQIVSEKVNWKKLTIG